jgi:hypothetical protein
MRVVLLALALWGCGGVVETGAAAIADDPGFGGGPAWAVDEDPAAALDGGADAEPATCSPLGDLGSDAWLCTTNSKAFAFCGGPENCAPFACDGQTDACIDSGGEAEGVRVWCCLVP